MRTQRLANALTWVAIAAMAAACVATCVYLVCIAAAVLAVRWG